MRAMKGLHFAGYKKSSPMLAAAAAIVASIGLPLAAQGQASGAADSASLNEIVVTANKLNAQKVLDIPVSIQAISGDALQSAGVVRNHGHRRGHSRPFDSGPGSGRQEVRHPRHQLHRRFDHRRVLRRGGDQRLECR